MKYTKEEFARKLTYFFERHDPDKKRMVPALVEEFHGKEDEVFAELTDRYVDKDEDRTEKKSGGGSFSVPSSPNTSGAP
jgi:hypothetical protein